MHKCRKMEEVVEYGVSAAAAPLEGKGWAWKNCPDLASNDRSIDCWEADPRRRGEGRDWGPGRVGKCSKLHKS